MKNIFTILTAFLLANTVLSQDWIEFTTSETTVPSYDLSKSLDTIVEFELLVPGMFSTAIDSFNRVQINEHLKLDSVGFAEIPIVSYLVAIPECDSVNLEISLLDSIKIDEIFIYPAPELVPDTVEGGAIALVEQFAYNRTAYETDSYFPGYIAEVIDKGAIRAQNVVRILFYPVQFNPVKHEAWIYSKVHVGLTFYNSNGSINNDVGIFNEVIGNTLINYNSNGLNASISCGVGFDISGTIKWVTSFPNGCIEDSCDYLIITHEDFYNDVNAKIEIEALAQHRADFNGFNVCMTKMYDIATSPDIDGDDSHEKMRNLIKNTYNSQNAYHTYDGKLAYVNLIGDNYFDDGETICVPSHPMPDPEALIDPCKGYDVFFTQLTESNGNYDIYPDIMIGRCPADSPEQVENIVTKILNFDPQSEEWKDDMLFYLGCNLDQGGYPGASEGLMSIDEIVGNLMNSKLMKPSNFQYPDYPYPLNWVLIPHTEDSFLNAYQDGALFLHYMGHGSTTSWAGSCELDDFDFGYLNENHEDKLPYIISSACFTGAFHNINDCMAEQFLCSSPNTGAIGFYGATSVVVMMHSVINPSILNSIFNNYAYVLGETALELKINHYSNDELLYEHNYFGDPALNIFYENYEFIYPDLLIKYDDISVEKHDYSVGDNVIINARIKNFSPVATMDDFNVSCYLGDPETIGSVLIQTQIIEGIAGYGIENLTFNWNTSSYPSDYYDIYIVLDEDNDIEEIIENNNVNFTQMSLYEYRDGFPITLPVNTNSYPISYDIFSEVAGNEIIVGLNVISETGMPLFQQIGSSNGYTSIGNLNNDEEYQFIEIRKESGDKRVMCPINNQYWQDYLLPADDNTGPVIDDINNDGVEEVLISNMHYDNFYNGYQSLICLNNDGSERWVFNDFEVIPAPGGGGEAKIPTLMPISCSMVNTSIKTIILIADDGNIYFLTELENGTGAQISNVAFLEDFSGFFCDPECTDLDKDGTMEMILFYRNSASLECLGVFDFGTMNINSTTLPETVNYSSPVLSDIDNDGLFEIILCSPSNGIFIYNKQLILVDEILNDKIFNTCISVADVNGDNFSDFVCSTGENEGKNYLKIIDINNQVLYKTPLRNFTSFFWLDDVDFDSELEIIYTYNKELYITDTHLEFNLENNDIYQGNHHNSGVLEHPAYFAPEGDTVYWMNTISLSAEVDNIIPEGSTVIIKPGTKIKAHESSSLIVQGTLIAEGTERFPISFTADINNADKGHWQGITAANGSAISMQHCMIKDAEIGILFEDDNAVIFENNHLENNIEAVAAFDSSPVLKENIITGNDIGLGSYNNAAPVLTDLIYEQRFKNGIINNETGIWINSSNLYADNGYNDIYNDPLEGYYINYISMGPPVMINARNNYWGTTDYNQIKTHIKPNILVKPYLTSPQSAYDPETDEESGMLKTAAIAMNEEDYSTAVSTLESIISQFPESDEAYFSVSALFECTGKSGENWNDLKSYFSNLYDDSTYNAFFKKLLFGYINLCHRKLANFSEAITNYESIILNNPSYSDSIFAVIDIGNTYEEAGNYKSTLGQLSEYIPVSRSKHVEKTVDLLLSLKSSGNSLPFNTQDDSQVINVFPNPLNDKVTLKIYHTSKSSLSIKVFDVTGRELLSRDCGIQDKGEISIELSLSDLLPGVYYGVLQTNHLTVDVFNFVKL